VLRVDPDRPEAARVETPTFEGVFASRLARWGGSALGLACLLEGQGTADEPGLVLSVGRAVARGVPTAARATVQGRAPLSGRYAEGHVGGELGARLARFADALLLVGRTRGPGVVLTIDERGRVARLECPELSGASVASTAAALERRLGPCATLAVGPAGEQGLAVASLGSGHAPPSFVGRGGLGARLGEAGLKALCLVGPPPVRAERTDALQERLLRSPRLAARAQGGTFELFGAAAARGDLSHELARRWHEDARERARERHGCRGCPTPCGWVFEREGGARQGARFGAGRALGPELGLELEEALVLLARCDELGVDAKEIGALLVLECLARERGLVKGTSPRGDRAALLRCVDELVEGSEAPGAAGTAVRARALGLADEVTVAHGQAVLAERDLAARLGQCVASGGADPMRTFPFLVGSSSSAALAVLLDPFPVDDATLDPRSPTGKGRLVAWHENLVAAIDMTGFCAFSAAGLLADGLCDRDELARWILPETLAEPDDREWAAVEPGTRLLAAGANLVLARRELARRWGATELEDRPNFARQDLMRPGMLDEYRRLRAAGDEVLGTPRALSVGVESLALSSPPVGFRPAPVAEASVTVHLPGTFADGRGEEVRLGCVLPAPLREVLQALARRHPELRERLFAGEAPLPAVWRGGERVGAEDPVHPDDVLELVAAIGGG
jgi:aldehyde:ferredoxin oxidoreductase